MQFSRVGCLIQTIIALIVAIIIALLIFHLTNPPKPLKAVHAPVSIQVRGMSSRSVPSFLLV